MTYLNPNNVIDEFSDSNANRSMMSGVRGTNENYPLSGFAPQGDTSGLEDSKGASI